MTFSMSQKWIFVSIFLVILSLVVYRFIYPDDLSINANFFRDNPDFIYQKDAHHLLICRAEYYDEEIKNLLENPNLPFLRKKRWIKDEEARSILTWKMGNKKYVIKRYNISNIFHWIKQLIPYASSKALRAFYYSYLFDKMDIKSAKAIAIFERRIGPFHGTCYQIMEQIQGMRGADYFEKSNEASMNYEKSIKETIDIAKQLEQAHLIHGELKLNHLFYVEGTPYLIDLDSVQHYKSNNLFFRRKRKLKDLNLLVDDFQEKLEKNHQQVFKEYYQEQLDPNIKTVQPNF